MFMTNLETQDYTSACIESGHNFIVEKINLRTDNGIIVPEHVGIVDVTNNRYLGTVGKGWTPVQPQTIYEIGDELIKSTNAVIKGGFSLNNGSVMGITFKLAEREYIAGDPIDLNFMMINAFNGKYAISGQATTFRHNAGTSINTSGKIYNLKHTKNVENRIQVVKEMMKYYENEIKNFDANMTHLAGQRMNEEQAVSWFRSLFPNPSTEAAERRLENQVAIFIGCLREGMGSNIIGVKNTAYGAFQALTEYICFKRSTRVHNGRDEEEVRFESIHFGSGNTVTQKGLGNLLSSFVFSEDDFLID